MLLCSCKALTSGLEPPTEAFGGTFLGVQRVPFSGHGDYEGAHVRTYRV